MRAARVTCQQVGVGAPPQVAPAAVDRGLDLNHGSRLDQIDAALAAVGLRLDVGVVAIHSGSFTRGCEERRHLTVTVAAGRGTWMGHARYLNVRCHHVTVSQPTGGNSPDIQGSLRPVSGSWAWRRGRPLPEGGRTGRDASAIRMGDTTYHAMAFAEGDIDNDGRFEPLAADMMPYGSGADIDAACAPVLPPDAGRLLHGTARTSANTLQVRDAAGAFRNRVAGVRGRRHRLGLVGSVRRSGLRRRPRPVHGQRHGRRGVRVPYPARSCC